MREIPHQTMQPSDTGRSGAGPDGSSRADAPPEHELDLRLRAALAPAAGAAERVARAALAGATPTRGRRGARAWVWWSAAASAAALWLVLRVAPPMPISPALPATPIALPALPAAPIALLGNRGSVYVLRGAGRPAEIVGIDGERESVPADGSWMLITRGGTQ